MVEWLQQQVLFPAPLLPVEHIRAQAERVGATLVDVPADDGVGLLGWYRRARGERLLLYFHGNAESVLDRVNLQDVLIDEGIDFFMVAYRGYPGSEGTPSEAGLRSDAVGAWRYAVDELGFEPSRIVVHGKSLGGGVAGLLCATACPAALVLESTFLSVVEVVRDRSPHPRLAELVTERFDTASRAEQIACPVLVIHGDADRVIKVRHGRELWKKFPNAAYVELADAAHGESLTVVEPQARAAYLDLLAQLP